MYIVKTFNINKLWVSINCFRLHDYQNTYIPCHKVLPRAMNRHKMGAINNVFATMEDLVKKLISKKLLNKAKDFTVNYTRRACGIISGAALSIYRNLKNGINDFYDILGDKTSILVRLHWSIQILMIAAISYMLVIGQDRHLDHQSTMEYSHGSWKNEMLKCGIPVCQSVVFMLTHNVLCLHILKLNPSHPVRVLGLVAASLPLLRYSFKILSKPASYIFRGLKSISLWIFWIIKPFIFALIYMFGILLYLLHSLFNVLIGLLCSLLIWGILVAAILALAFLGRRRTQEKVTVRVEHRVVYI